MMGVGDLLRRCGGGAAAVRAVCSCGGAVSWHG